MGFLNNFAPARSRSAFLAAAFLLGGCGGGLAGWDADPMAEAVPALRETCRRPGALPEPICAEAARLPAGDQDAARQFFSAWFQPGEVQRGLVTGYYEPEITGSLTPAGPSSVPLYRPPADRNRFDRAAIETGALSGRGLELLWIDDPVEAFFLHIQGAGRVKLREGGIVRVGYAGDNGRRFVPIGRLLIEDGALPRAQATMKGIRDWLRADPVRGAAMMRRNPRFIFFRQVDGLSPQGGPVGAMGVPLVPGRSIAVDTRHIPMGSVLWLETTNPLDGSPIRRIVVAQDRGNAIVGSGRVDLFWGWGAEAGRRAGAMRAQGRLTLLQPRPSPGS